MELQYTVDAFNRLPSLSYANDQFLKMNGQAVLETSLRDLFVRHQVTQTFGVALLHQHFDLENHEILVDVNGTSMPWDLRGTSTSSGNFQKYGGIIKPMSWMVGNGYLVPYEFYFDRTPSADAPELSTEFIGDLNTVLKANNLFNAFGLCLLRNGARHQAEVTECRANVTFSLDESARLDIANSDDYIQAAWQFPNTEIGKPQTRDWCLTFCMKADPTGIRTHVGYHSK